MCTRMVGMMRLGGMLGTRVVAGGEGGKSLLLMNEIS